MFEEILSTFENDDIREFAEETIKNFPDYFWHVGASSTGKYHPQYACGEGGLYRHTLALCRILNHILTIDSVKNKFSSRDRDLMRLAGLKQIGLCCEIMADDGTMMRQDGLIKLAEKHNIKFKNNYVSNKNA